MTSTDPAAWTRPVTTAEAITRDNARTLAQRVLSAHRVHTNFALERGKKVADMHHGPEGRHIYEAARLRDEAARLEYEQQHQRLTRLVLDLIHTRDELTARLNQQH